MLVLIESFSFFFRKITLLKQPTRIETKVKGKTCTTVVKLTVTVDVSFGNNTIP